MKTEMRTATASSGQRIKAGIVMALACVILTGCHKDVVNDTTVPEPTPVEIVDSEGSWWKYEWFEIDQTGTAISLGMIDSFYVDGDTIINGNTLVHIGGVSSFYGTGPHRFLRDSANCILNSYGDIIYSNQSTVDTSQIYTVTPLTAYTLVGSNPTSYTVPAGTFTDVLENQTHFYMTDGSDFACGNHWIQRKVYAEGVGLIMSQCAIISQVVDSCIYFEMRLIDYHVAP
jgi:hypothetical protein